MKRLLRYLLRFTLLIALVLVALHLFTMARNGDAELASSAIQGDRILVVNHGFHSGIVISTTALRRTAIDVGRQDRAAAERLRWLAGLYPTADWIEIGWGDAAFYQQTPSIADVDVLLGLMAILLLTEAVFQVVPGWGRLDDAFPGADKVLLVVSRDGLTGLARRLAATVPEPVPTIPVGPSLYGYGAFYPAELDYHLLRTCNHWVAWLLRATGAPASPVPGTFSIGLITELRWRLHWGI